MNYEKCYNSFEWIVTFLHLPDLRLLLIDGSSQQREDDAGLRINTDRSDQHLTAALHHVRATKYHRIVVLTLLHVI